jgi:hypothetical protein
LKSLKLSTEDRFGPELQVNKVRPAPALQVLSFPQFVQGILVVIRPLDTVESFRREKLALIGHLSLRPRRPGGANFLDHPSNDVKHRITSFSFCCWVG